MSFASLEFHFSRDAVIAAAAVFAIVFAVWYIFFRKPSLEEILTKIFGKPLYAISFSLNDARNWINARKNLLINGSKAVILKINSHTIKPLADECKKIGIDIDDPKSGKFLVIAVVSTADSSNIREDIGAVKFSVYIHKFLQFLQGFRFPKTHFFAQSQDTTASLLVKYKELSKNLEDVLSKGDGVLRVEA